VASARVRTTLVKVAAASAAYPGVVVPSTVAPRAAWAPPWAARAEDGPPVELASEPPSARANPARAADVADAPAKRQENPLPSKNAMGFIGRVMMPLQAARRVRKNLGSWRDKKRAERMNIDSLKHQLDEATVILLRAKFVKYDKDNSGQVSVSELGKLMDDLGFQLTSRGIIKLQRELDRTGEGLVSLQELVIWYDTKVTLAIERERKRRTGWRKHWARAKAADVEPLRRARDDRGDLLRRLRRRDDAADAI
jgi:hypothetical protein